MLFRSVSQSRYPRHYVLIRFYETVMDLDLSLGLKALTQLDYLTVCQEPVQWQTFWRVIFPPLLPSILTGIALGFSRAVGEYGSTVIIASNLPFKDLIAPVLIIQQLEQYNYTGATVIGTVMLFISLILLFLINLLQAWGRRYDQ